MFQSTCTSSSISLNPQSRREITSVCHARLRVVGPRSKRHVRGCLRPDVLAYHCTMHGITVMGCHCCGWTIELLGPAVNCDADIQLVLLWDLTCFVVTGSGDMLCFSFVFEMRNSFVKFFIRVPKAPEFLYNFTFYFLLVMVMNIIIFP